ncbi:hypothetical protein ARTHRO9V_90027 [Arthrobacter sp. 9V]|nr:hypothetical protein ARTHRO9V_90027 [Arthrobacter sp. 9V]
MFLLRVTKIRNPAAPLPPVTNHPRVTSLRRATSRRRNRANIHNPARHNRHPASLVSTLKCLLMDRAASTTSCPKADSRECSKPKACQRN